MKRKDVPGQLSSPLRKLLNIFGHKPPLLHINTSALLAFLCLWFTTGFAFAQEKQIPELSSVAEDIYIYKPSDYNLKLVVADFEQYLVLVEFPVGDSLMRAVIKDLNKLFPNKPIRYVLHSHHHNHAASGFDPFLDLTSANLVTGAYNFEKIKDLSKNKRALQAHYLRIRDNVRFRSSNNELQVFTIKDGKYKLPTEEYNLVYFPKQKILVSGCLYQKPLDYHQVVNARKLALNDFIKDYKLDVDYLIPTNTNKKVGFEDVCTFTMLQETLKYGVNPEKVADFFQSKSMAYLQTQKDSIIAVIKQKPAFYDYYQCAKTLMKRKAYDRALFIFELIPQLYTDISHNVYLYAGDCCKFKSSFDEARTYYKKYIECALNEMELERGRSRIEDLHKQ